MRFTFLVGTLERGGVERLVVDWVDRLRHRHECSLICLLGKKGPLVQQLESMGVRVLDFERHPRDPRFVIELSRLLRQLGPDLVHSQCAWSLPQQVLATKLAGIQGFVLTIHSTYEMAGLVARSRRLIGAGLSRRWIDAVVGVSRAVSEWSEEWLRLPSGSVLTILNGVDPNRFSDQAVQRVTGEPLKRQSPATQILMAVGSLTEHKDHRTLIKALDGLIRLGLDVECLIVGTGPLGQRLETMVAELGLADRVRFLGARGDVPALMKGADVFVHPSTREGFGLVVAEAHAAGLPVVATDVGGVSEIVRDGVSGYLVRPGDADGMTRALSSLLADRDLQIKMGSRGQEWVQDLFSIEHCIMRYEALYATVLNSEDRRGDDLQGTKGSGSGESSIHGSESKVR